MKTLVPLDLRYQKPILKVSNTPRSYVHLLREADREPFLAIVNRLNELAEKSTPYVPSYKVAEVYDSELNTSELNTYLAGSIPVNRFFDDSKNYEDIDLVGVSNKDTMSYICQKITTKPSQKSAFDYNHIKFAVRHADNEGSIIPHTRRFIITNKDAASKMAPIDLTLIVDKEFDKVIRKLA